MEIASCLLICGNTALYLALISRLPYLDGALPAMLLALGLGLLMLLLAARFRKIPVVRIGVAPLPLLSLLLLPPGPAWISFLPAPLIMAFFAVMDRFDWDDWQTSRWMRPALIFGTFLILHFALQTPPAKEGVILCTIFFALGIIGLRMLRMGRSESDKVLMNVGGVLLPIAIGAGAGSFLWLSLKHRELLREFFYWLIYPLIWLTQKFFSAEAQEERETLFHELFGDAQEATPPPLEEMPTEESIAVLRLPEINWPLVFSVILAVAAVVVVTVILFRLNTGAENGRDIEYIPEKKEQKRNKRRPKSTRAVNRVRDAYRTYLMMLRVRREIPLKESDTSLQVTELPGQELAEELRQIYLQARYAGKATPEDARRAETDVKKIRERLLSEERE